MSVSLTKTHPSFRNRRLMARQTYRHFLRTGESKAMYHNGEVEVWYDSDEDCMFVHVRNQNPESIRIAADWAY
jgi:hypothetical protein